MKRFLPSNADKNIPLLTTIGLSQDVEATVLYSNFLVDFTRKLNFNSHQHSFFELHISLNKTGLIRYGRENVVLNCNDGILIPPGRLHNLQSCEDDYCMMALAFNININPKRQVEPKFFTIDDNDIFYLQTLMNEYSNGEVGYESAMGAAASAFVVRILRRLDVLKDFDIEAAKKHVSKKNSLKIALEYINGNLQHRITVDDVANAAFVSTRHLNRIFEDNFNKSVTAYIKNEKLNIAKDYLTKTDFSIKEIAFLAGMENDSYFCKIFKKDTGISPNAFREKWNVDYRNPEFKIGDEDEFTDDVIAGDVTKENSETDDI